MITELDTRDINLLKIEKIDKLLSSMNEDLELIRSDNMKPELHLCYLSCKLKILRMQDIINSNNLKW